MKKTFYYTYTKVINGTRLFLYGTKDGVGWGDLNQYKTQIITFASEKEAIKFKQGAPDPSFFNNADIAALTKNKTN